jgi:hypothetical protein
VTLTPAGRRGAVGHAVVREPLCCAGHTQQPPETPHFVSQQSPVHPVVT